MDSGSAVAAIISMFTDDLVYFVPLVAFNAGIIFVVRFFMSASGAADYRIVGGR